jgi:hypothetical protein
MSTSKSKNLSSSKTRDKRGKYKEKICEAKRKGIQINFSKNRIGSYAEYKIG